MKIIKGWYRFFLLAVLVLVGAGCKSTLSPTSTPMPTDIKPTNTSWPTVTSTFTATVTLVPTRTATPMPTLTPTPDIRVIDEAPKEFLCTKEDLPSSGTFILPQGAMSPHHNYEILQQRGQKEGQRYLDDTGRIDGWWVYFKRITGSEELPHVIECNPVQYASVEGAHIAFEKYNPVVDQGGELVNSKMGIGEESLSYHMYDESSNYYYTGLFVRYRNYILSFWGLNIGGDYPPVDSLVEVANNVLQRLENASLVEGPLQGR